MSIVTSSSKFYIRFRGEFPETELMAHAKQGLETLGAEVVPFYYGDDIDSMEDLGPETGVIGYICDVKRALDKLNKPMPAELDYPDSLKPWYHRKITQGTICNIINSTETLFIKPTEQKLFTGFVWKGCTDRESRMRIVTIPNNTPIWISEVVDFVSEYRCVIRDGKIVDVRRYKGDWSIAPNRIDVECAVKNFISSGESPTVCCIDFGIMKSGATAIVEVNDGFAFGHYGMNPVEYAKCLATRWYELAK